MNHIVSNEAYTYSDAAQPVTTAYLYNGYAFQSGTGLVGEWRGLNLDFSGLTATTHYTNVTGILIGDIPQGLGTNYSIHTGTAPSWFNAAVDTTRLTIGGHTFSDGGNGLFVRQPLVVGVGGVNIRATDSPVANTGPFTSLQGRYSTSDSTLYATFATYGGEWDAANASGAYVGDAVIKVQLGLSGGLGEVYRAKGTDLSSNFTGAGLFAGALSSPNYTGTQAQGTTLSATPAILSRDNTALAASNGAAVGLQYVYTSGGAYATGAAIKTYKDNGTDGNFAGSARVFTNNGTTLVEGWRLTSDQRVSIGTGANPLQKLQVAGSIGLNNDAGSTALNNGFFVFNGGGTGATNYGTNTFMA
jgi:hypothetical protein